MEAIQDITLENWLSELKAYQRNSIVTLID